jgi:hypothetical protein
MCVEDKTSDNKTELWDLQLLKAVIVKRKAQIPQEGRRRCSPTTNFSSAQFPQAY